ncbi:PAS domain S-box protein [Hymenobacter sp. UYP22]|uniref:PAS domain-containing sensor histidine kinase n=1 Tax=Hymenobacter sp. UYP22 TaxID=3156348 RepID=UPI003397585B
MPDSACSSLPAAAVSADWLLDTLPSGLLVLDEEGRIRRLNQQAATWWGLPAGQLVGQLIADAPAAALPPELHAALRQLPQEAPTASATYFLPQHQQWLSLVSQRQQAYCVVHWQPVAPPAQEPAALPSEAAFSANLTAYQTFFQAIDEGFCVIEMLLDHQSRPIDYRFLSTNSVFERQTGLQNVVGRCVSELAPSLEQHWFDTYGHVALTGEPLRFEQRAAELHRWFNVLAFRVGEPAQRYVAVLFRDDTARKRAEDALRQSEEHFRVVANLVPDLLWTNAPQGATDWCNQRWLEYTGQTLEEVLGYGWTNVIHPDDREQSHRQFQAAVDAGRPLYLEHRIRSASGEYRWFQVRVIPFTQQQGQILQWVGAATDVHERRLVAEAIAEHKLQLERQVAERTQALEESQELLRSVFEASVNSVSVLKAVRDTQNEIIDFEYVLSNQISRLYNNGANDPGTSYTSVHPGIRQTVLFQRFQEVVESGQRVDVELFYGHEDINQWFRVIAVKLQDGLVVMAENITDRRTYEQEQAYSLQLLQQAEEVSLMGSWEYHLAEQRMQWSAGMHRLYHWASGNNPVTPLIYLKYAVPESYAAAEKLVEQLLAGSTGLDETLRLRLNGGEKTIRVKAILVADAEGQPARLVGMDVDISERQQLEQENLRLRLTQQQGLFAAVQQAREVERRRVAEGLHNGVGQILYATKLRLEQLSPHIRHLTPDAGVAYRESSQLLGEAIRQIRDLSHELVPHILESFGLSTAFLDICHKLSSPRLRLDCRSMLADAQHKLSGALQLALYRMAQELAQNIVKHAPGATQALVRLEATAEEILLRAEDNGGGFISDPSQSTGLGLRSIRNQVALLGGTMTVGVSELGGARVQLHIPLTSLPIL